MHFSKHKRPIAAHTKSETKDRIISHSITQDMHISKLTSTDLSRIIRQIIWLHTSSKRNIPQSDAEIKKKGSNFPQGINIAVLFTDKCFALISYFKKGITSNRSLPYVQSVPHDTRIRPSVDAVRPRTAPWWPGNWQIVRLGFMRQKLEAKKKGSATHGYNIL